MTLLRGKIPEIPPHGTLQFYHNRAGTLYRVVAQLLRTGDANHYLFHYSAALSVALGELETKIVYIAANRKPVIFLGETGTGRSRLPCCYIFAAPRAVSLMWW